MRNGLTNLSSAKKPHGFFENDLLEFLTRTPWWAIPLIWVPVACWFVSSSVEASLPPYHVAATMVAGIFIWTLLEYCLHRFLFHIKTYSYWLAINYLAFLLSSQFCHDEETTCRGNTIHYLLHGCHHKHPMDGLRLVFPPAAAVILAVPLWTVIKLLVPAPYSAALFGGGLLGYVMYDCTHYYLHHGKPLKGVSHDLKKYHMSHHFRIQDMGFGITSTFWDRVFGTLPPKSAKKDSSSF